ncbi:NAD(P)H-quinone oxidoreductase chain 4 1 [Thiorhodovibrio winogradskyi]|uniref:NAD(P)H-quinone oxidoreductase chain 4 1 n=1 Tax=Thiorhodovibrio winogradskyi TaxID=77007 RepID=A0ABZ0S9P4_9GAMM|nr:proton-conducting transporter membrane subunit [Thiorhodovibrio winogradskyi]
MTANSATLPLPWPTAPIVALSADWSWQALSPLDWMFVAALVTLLLALVLGRWRVFAPLFAAGYGAQFWALAHADVLTGQPLVASFALRILRQPVVWRYDSLSWFFAMLTIGAAFVCTLFALAPASNGRAPLFAKADAKADPGADSGTYLGAELGARQTKRLVTRLGASIASRLGPGSGLWHLFHVALALSVLSSLCLFGSGNLLALYVSWEVVVWAFFLLLAVGGGLALGAAVRYAAYSFAGGVALLGALALVFRASGSFDFARVSAALPTLGLGQELLLGLLLLVALGLRLGALPLFAWQPGQVRPPVPVFWHGIAARVGFFALLVLLSRMVGVEWLASMGGLARGGWLDPRLLLCWVALLLVLFGGWRAWRQRCAGAVLSWLALSQTGFVLLALLVGGEFGTASGLLQLFSLGLAEAVLAGLCLVAVPLVSVPFGSQARSSHSGRVETGLRGLALAAALLSGASLVGLPPTLGFVSKWLLYDAILTDPLLGLSRWPLFWLALLGSGLSLLALLRLAAIMRARSGEKCTGRPDAIMAPVLGLSALTLLAGVVPGPAMGWVAAMQRTLGVPVLDWTLGGVAGRIDMLWLTLWQGLLLLPLLAVLWWVWRSASESGERVRAFLWRLLGTVPTGGGLLSEAGRPPMDHAVERAGDQAVDQGRDRRPLIEPLFVALLDRLAGLVVGLSGPRLAPWTLAAVLLSLMLWAFA